jgi:hypothetical protein
MCSNVAFAAQVPQAFLERMWDTTEMYGERDEAKHAAALTFLCEMQAAFSRFSGRIYTSKSFGISFPRPTLDYVRDDI